jgi:hypothetical protein
MNRSTDTLIYLPLSQVSLEPSFFPSHIPMSRHNSVLLYRQTELKSHGIIFTRPGNAQRIQTEDVEWKQFTGKGKPNMWYGNSHWE